MSKVTFSSPWEPDDPPNHYINRIDLGPDSTTEQAAALAKDIEKLLVKHKLPRTNPSSLKKHTVRVESTYIDYFEVKAANLKDAKALALKKAQRKRKGAQSFGAEG